MAEARWCGGMRRSRAKNFARESLVLFYQVYMSFIVYLLKGSFATECILNLKPSALVATRSRPPSPRHPYDHIKPTTIAFKPKPSSTSRCAVPASATTIANSRAYYIIIIIIIITVRITVIITV